MPKSGNPQPLSQPFHPEDSHLQRLHHLRRLSDLWDRSLTIPGTNFRLGLESLVGILPVGGDVIGVILSCYILAQAVRFGLPRAVLVRMIFNIAIDGLVGSVPILGDIFDTTWKANTKNVNLLEAHLRSPQTSQKAGRSFLWLLGLVLGAIALLLVSLTILLVWLLVRLSHG